MKVCLFFLSLVFDPLAVVTRSYEFAGFGHRARHSREPQGKDVLALRFESEIQLVHVCFMQLVLLDNAVSSLCARCSQEVTAGRTTIFVAHRLSTVVDCDLILVFGAGQVRLFVACIPF